MPPFTPHPDLDLLAPTHASGFRFDLLDGATLNRAGTLSADMGAAVTVDHDVDRAIKRTLGGLRLTPSVASEVNPLTDRVQPVMVTADGTEWPLGVFLFDDWSGARSSLGVERSGSLHDGGVILDQQAPKTVTFGPGSVIRDALVSVLTQAGVRFYAIDATDARVSMSAPATWKAGTKWSVIVNDLAGMAGLYSPAFDHLGVARIIRPPAADDTAQADVTYDPGGRILDDTIVESDTTLSAPNRYICVDTAAGDTPVSGIYDVPASAPFSIAARGYAVTTQVEGQGLTAASAAAAAERAYLASRLTETVTFATPPDPRHDSWNVVAYRGAVWRESGWKIACSAGGAMTHNLRRTYR